jgi:hypothetical protein
MLSKLKDILIQQKDDLEFPINGLFKGCCAKSAKATCVVIDFDKVKEGLKEQTPSKSCDAVQFATNQIDFIELKGFEKFKQYHPNATVTDIQEQVTKFNFEKKLNDSYSILLDIVVKGSEFTDEDRSEFENVTSRYFVVTDISLENALLDITLSLNFLGSTSSIDTYIKTSIHNQLNNITASFLTEKPKLVSCDDICNYLNIGNHNVLSFTSPI